MEKLITITILTIAISLALFTWLMQFAHASNTKMSFTILPVRFVYMDNGEIVKIWNNVTPEYTRYGITFYESEGKVEPTEDNWLDYMQAMSTSNPFGEGDIYPNGEYSLVEYIIVGDNIEEVVTIL